MGVHHFDVKLQPARDTLLNNNAAFRGKMPISVVNLSTTLQGLSFNATRISGSIPSAISNLVSLQFLSLGDTSISGAILESVGELADLGMLGLFNTDLSGQYLHPSKT